MARRTNSQQASPCCIKEYPQGCPHGHMLRSWRLAFLPQQSTAPDTSAHFLSGAMRVRCTGSPRMARAAPGCSSDSSHATALRGEPLLSCLLLERPEKIVTNHPSPSSSHENSQHRMRQRKGFCAPRVLCRHRATGISNHGATPAAGAHPCRHALHGRRQRGSLVVRPKCRIDTLAERSKALA